MASATSTQYIKELHRHFGYWAAWSPGVPLSLGTLGEFEDGVFVPTSHLFSFGIRFRTIKDETPSDLTYQSEGSVAVTFKAKGETKGLFKNLSEFDAGVGVDFNRANAVYFSATGCYEDRIADIEKLKSDVMMLPASTWPSNVAVVTHLQRAETATVLISGTAGSRVELKAAADIGHAVINVADVAAQVSIAYSDKMATQIVSSRGLTPLFRAIRRKRRVLGREDVVFADSEGRDEWEDVVYDSIFS